MARLFDVILIETHNACTRTCWFCKFGQLRQDAAAEEMSWPTIERIVGNLRDLDYGGRISWFWINEPLMDARLLAILRFTRRECPRAFLSLVTNGDLLTDALYRDLRQSGLDALGVSVYDNLAGRRIAAVTPDERLVPIDMRRGRGRSLDNRGGNIARHGRLFQSAQQQALETGCERPSSMMTVNARGQVTLCCSDLYSDVVMGDIAISRLEHIWNNEAFRHYRTHLAEHGRQGLKLCEGCSYGGRASPVHYPLKAMPADMSASAPTAAARARKPVLGLDPQIAAGPPEEAIVKRKKRHTGQFSKEVLARHPARRSVEAAE
jgi:MoaA/NifB/PqqE/SkfB family radical SAM enzyme